MATLYITIPADLADKYAPHVEAHNLHVSSDEFPNSGFDLIVPAHVTFAENNEVKTIDHGVCAEMRLSNGAPSAYILAPRSSIAKTPLSMANSIGIIDAGYRGALMAKVRYMPTDNTIGQTHVVNRGDKLFQVCLPSLAPFKVEIVSTLTDTTRGAGAFGSTSNN
jgi:dUTP pyrophosphatase